MKNSVSELLFIIFIIVTTAVCVLGLRKEFHVVEDKKTWQDARDHCRTHHTDLATVRSQEEAARLPLSTTSKYAWIGLHRDATDLELWRWTELIETPLLNSSDNNNWWISYIQYQRNCTYVHRHNDLWYSIPCSHRMYFLCNNGTVIQLREKYLTWEKARQHCEDNYQGLATITEKNAMMVPEHNRSLWIGLFRDVDDVWKWAGETQSDFRNWHDAQPDDQHCGIIGTERKWRTAICNQHRPFICYEEKLILVKENKTWEEALEFCRSLTADLIVDPTAYNNHRYDLASLLSDEDHRYANEIIRAATTDQVWTGLRFLAGRWLWVNGDQLQYQDLPLCPAQWQHCGTLPKDGATPWDVRNCQERRNFFCFKRG